MFIKLDRFKIIIIYLSILNYLKKFKFNWFYIKPVIIT